VAGGAEPDPALLSPLHVVEGLLGCCVEGDVDVGSVNGAGFDEGLDAQPLGHGLSGGGVYDPVEQVYLVAYEDNWGLRLHLAEGVEPVGGVGEGLLPGHIEHQERTGGAPVVVALHLSVGGLAAQVPDDQPDPAVLYLEGLGCDGCAYGALVVPEGSALREPSD